MRIPGYKAERLMARGGMSSVYLAMQESLSRRVALKVLRRFDNPRQAERFLHEARIIASLQHRNIITIHDVGTMGERHYIAMEYLEGGSLADRIDHGIPPMQALDLLESMASCLDFVHRKDIVHRDIKPSNILFHADGTPKLTDFGIAKQIDGDQELTMEGSAFGSPYYLSPEQAEDRLLDGRSDIYGLGIVFYQMLTGRRPYEESSHIETIVAHLSNPIPVLPEELSGYQGLLEKMIAKSPENRVGSAGELVALIQQVRSSQSGPSANTAASRGEGARKGLLARASGASFLVRLSAVAALLVLIVGSLRLIGDSPSGQAAAPRLVSRVPSIELSYEAAKARVEPQAVVNESKTVTVGATSLPETNRLPGDPDKPSIAEPMSEVADAPVAEPVETIKSVAEVVTDQQDEQDAVSAPETADDSSERIDDLMRAGDRALKANRLTTPAADNAYAYYTSVIELDPANRAAHEGLDRIASRYAVLARRVLRKEDRQRARRYVERGISVQRNHADLLAIRGDLDELDRLAAIPPAPEVVAESSPVRQEPRISSMEFEGTIVTSQGREGTGNLVKDFKNVWRSVFD